MSPKRTGMHFLFCFVDLALIAPNIRWIRRFSAAAQHLIMVHFNLSPLIADISYLQFRSHRNLDSKLTIHIRNSPRTRFQNFH